MLWSRDNIKSKCTLFATNFSHNLTNIKEWKEGRERLAGDRELEEDVFYFTKEEVDNNYTAND